MNNHNEHERNELEFLIDYLNEIKKIPHPCSETIADMGLKIVEKYMSITGEML